MKKIFTLFATMLTVASMNAQSFVFVDKDGKTIENGSVLTMSEVEDDGFGDLQIPLKGIYVKNISDLDENASIDWNVKTIPSGSFACCLGDVCMNATSAKTIKTANVEIESGKSLELTRTEWCPADKQYGTCEVELQLGEGSQMNGPKITVKFVYAETTSIKSAKADVQDTVYYSILGQKASKEARGIMLMRTADGSIKKVMIK